ncbi:MAG: N-acetyltransferase family protein [Roseibium sp.]
MAIRNAEPRDIPAILELYNQAVRETTAAWTMHEETLDDRITWFENRRNQNFPVTVAIDTEDRIVGFASFGPFRLKEGYRLTAEHTVYVDPKQHKSGTGTRLLADLIERASTQGVHVLVGVIDGENAASIALHKKLGFSVSGTIPEAGTKFGRWLDLVFVSKIISPDMQSPPA